MRFGSLTVGMPWTDVRERIVHYVFTDGQQVLDPSNSILEEAFLETPVNTGDIALWSFHVSNGDDFIHTQTIPFDVVDQVHHGADIAGTGSSGTWTFLGLRIGF